MKVRGFFCLFGFLGGFLSEADCLSSPILFISLQILLGFGFA